MRPFRLALGVVFLSASCFFFLNSAGNNITGAVVGITSGFSTFGVITAMVSGVLFVAGIEEKKKVLSTIKNNRTLVKLAEEASNSDRAQRGMDHLIAELEKGNVPARIRHLKGTDVFYIGNDEARVYYRIVGGGYEIVAKSRKGRNQ